MSEPIKVYRSVEEVEASEAFRQMVRSIEDGVRDRHSRLRGSEMRVGQHINEKWESILAKMDASIAEMDSFIIEANAVISGKRTICAEMDAVISAKESFIAKKEKLIADKEAFIADKEEVLAEVKADYAELRDDLMAQEKEAIDGLRAHMMSDKYHFQVKRCQSPESP